MWLGHDKYHNKYPWNCVELLQAGFHISNVDATIMSWTLESEQQCLWPQLCFIFPNYSSTLLKKKEKLLQLCSAVVMAGVKVSHANYSIKAQVIHASLCSLTLVFPPFFLLLICSMANGLWRGTNQSVPTANAISYLLAAQPHLYAITPWGSLNDVWTILKMSVRQA